MSFKDDVSMMIIGLAGGARPWDLISLQDKKVGGIDEKRGNNVMDFDCLIHDG